VAVLAAGAGALAVEGGPGRLVAWSVIPALWAAAWLALVCGFGDEGVVTALLRSLVFAAAYLPLALPLARGLGLWSLARGWLLPQD
jgi:hypothetical protein